MRVNWDTFWLKVVEATGETLLMVVVTLIFASILGLMIGLVLYVTRKGSLFENKFVFMFLNLLINIIRPIPFIIFLVAISPFTRLIMGTTIGTSAAIFPMTIVAAFAVARIVENNLVSIDPGMIEAAKALGATPFQIITGVLIREALGPLILGLTFITVALIDFSAMAGTVGGGGLGNLAMTYGYQRFDTSVMIVTIVLLIIFVQVAQYAGNYLSRKFLRR
ncbi:MULTISPECIES: methionine ABC transporter permease [Paenibacillus]|jgi:D-methionine transport system permease protein|uniref:ABC transporter permease n=1 Tax=Paenibacillus polymyxa TaxID=1406 RepID=A0AAE9IEP7_PAEPO|nr:MULTISPECIES: methionine ABC transporter permease [Paenibacillus]AOK91411.1 ABC transporter permease [Paenibacillus polymyxa]KAF6576210.1 ABC transporter permease [Paenibacillus sp. EKM212P]MCP3809091.1 ABC transporter permease [Paenibacillus sp. Lou8.1]MDY7992892.1 methionine ABC transporter permease [Paenibacillus polymyxa]MDY8048648.1 methionine ABC transporter permease [Paenibacillus polymyxa]